MWRSAAMATVSSYSKLCPRPSISHTLSTSRQTESSETTESYVFFSLYYLTCFDIFLFCCS